MIEMAEKILFNAQQTTELGQQLLKLLAIVEMQGRRIDILVDRVNDLETQRLTHAVGKEVYQ